jgi:hypothetical protein
MNSWFVETGYGSNVDIGIRKDNHTNTSWNSAGKPLYWKHWYIYTYIHIHTHLILHNSGTTGIAPV